MEEEKIAEKVKTEENEENYSKESFHEEIIESEKKEINLEKQEDQTSSQNHEQKGVRFEERTSSAINSVSEKESLVQAVPSNKFHEPSMYFSESTSALDSVSYLLLTQKPDSLETFLPFCCEIPNEYLICQTDEEFVSTQKVLGVALESSKCLPRYCCYQKRPFIIDLMIYGSADSRGKREMFCPIPFCSQSQILVTLEGKIIGFVKHNASKGMCSKMQVIEVTDHNHNLLYSLSADCCQPGCLCSCFGFIDKCRSTEFKILSKSEEQVGSVFHLYSNCIRETFTRADQFGIRFPSEASLVEKYLILFATLALDYIEYTA